METVECGIIALRPELSMLEILIHSPYRSGDFGVIFGRNDLPEPMLLHQISG
jgi:hypothetical protein